MKENFISSGHILVLLFFSDKVTMQRGVKSSFGTNVHKSFQITPTLWLMSKGRHDSFHL